MVLNHSVDGTLQGNQTAAQLGQWICVTTVHNIKLSDVHREDFTQVQASVMRVTTLIPLV